MLETLSSNTITQWQNDFILILYIYIYVIHIYLRVVNQLLFIVTNCFMKGVTINCRHPQSSDDEQQQTYMQINDHQVDR